MKPSYVDEELALQKGLKGLVQRFGMFLSNMFMPNIGAFIAWGFITALFIPTGWVPNEHLGKLVEPMLRFLLPLQLAATGGKLVGGKRGSVVGALATIGLIAGSEKTMFLGAMIMGPIGGFIIRLFDNAVQNKVKREFEVLINNFSVGIIGGTLTVLSFITVGPAMDTILKLLTSGVQTIVDFGLLPFVSVFVEPAKILFLNNDINLGVLGPIGAQQVKDLGKSVYFLIETNPGPGLGVLMAYWIFSYGSPKQSAPGAIIIHLFGGIHEIYFPYILMKPALVLAVIFGGASGLLTFNLLDGGLTSIPRPGSIVQIIAMSPNGGLVPVILGVTVSFVISFLAASIIIKSLPDDVVLAWKSK